jgi:hypothetical protein
MANVLDRLPPGMADWPGGGMGGAGAQAPFPDWRAPWSWMEQAGRQFMVPWPPSGQNGTPLDAQAHLAFALLARLSAGMLETWLDGYTSSWQLLRRTYDRLENIHLDREIMKVLAESSLNSETNRTDAPQQDW